LPHLFSENAPDPAHYFDQLGVYYYSLSARRRAR
jgi:hypothetical protein